MNRNFEQCEAEVSKTLELLDRMPQVEPSPRFRAQLMQRINAMEPINNGDKPIVSMALSPKVVFLALLLMLNIASAMLLFTSQTPQSTTSASGTLADSFSEDYGGPALSYYDDQSALGR